MSLQEKGSFEAREIAGSTPFPLGIYVHVPFCPTRCDFCALYEVRPRKGEMERYERGILTEIGGAEIDRKVDTVFWGGGTPGVLPATMMESIGGALREKLPAPPLEWSVEMAPSTVKIGRIRALKDLGVNRISIGVQSFSEEALETLGRRHSRKEVFRAIDLIRKEGIENLNLDLIFGMPGQSLEDWTLDLKEAFNIRPSHISAYCLTFEDDTPLFLKAKRGEIEPKDDTVQVGFYERSWQLMAENGYRQYEVSNYAMPGYECRHNLNTWRMGEWLGFGPSAATQVKGRRFTNIPSLDEWFAGIEEGEPRVVEEVSLAPVTLAQDFLIFGLRMNQGVLLSDLKERFPSIAFDDLRSLWRRLSEEGLMEDSNDGLLRLTPKGRLVADAVGVEILSFLDSST